MAKRLLTGKRIPIIKTVGLKQMKIFCVIENDDIIYGFINNCVLAANKSGVEREVTSDYKI